MQAARRGRDVRGARLDGTGGRVVELPQRRRRPTGDSRSGNTWYGASARRSGVNTETKLLMLCHAFDELGCVAVEFRTHFFNFASRTAIERLGAKLDGMLRSHQLLPDGIAARHRGVLDPRHRMAHGPQQSDSSGWTATARSPKLRADRKSSDSRSARSLDGRR